MDLKIGTKRYPCSRRVVTREAGDYGAQTYQGTVLTPRRKEET